MPQRSNRNALVLEPIRSLLSRSENEPLSGGMLRLLIHLAASYQAHEEGIVEHLQRIAAYVRILAEGMEMDSDAVLLLQYASVFHDVGMVDVPSELLTREGGLDEDELLLMRQHTEVGASLLSYSGTPLLDKAAEVALHHHERYDGKGYPYGVAGREIPLSGRIVAVADVFDALTMERPHKAPYPVGVAFEIIKGGSGRHFDPDVVSVFVERFHDMVKVREKLARANSGSEVSEMLVPQPQASSFELSARDRLSNQVFKAIKEGFFSCPVCKLLHPHETVSCYGEELRDIHKLSGRQILGKYVLKAAAGSGGMGVVYEAEHMLVGRRVAIKFLDPRYVKRGNSLERFFEEARASARVDHPNLVEVVDLDQTEEGIPFMVMEFLDGIDLADCLYEYESFSEEASAAICIAILETLEAVHAKNIVHRDLKPENIFFVEHGSRLKLLDFGISLLRRDEDEKRARRITAENRTLGTPAYMSPEQALGEEVDHRSDLFTIGTVLYEMVAGTRPFQGPNAMQIMLAVSRTAYVPPRVALPEMSDALVTVLERALRKRDGRFQSAREFIDALLPIAHRDPSYEPNTLLPFLPPPPTQETPAVQPAS